MSDVQQLNRKGFVKVVISFLGTIMSGVIGLPAIGYLLSPAMRVQKSEAWVPVGVLENYPVGAPTLFSFTRTKENGWEKTVNSYGVFVLRAGPNNVKVFSNKCTHLSCRVSWKDAEQEYLCPCHDAHFDIDGQVISGPPPAPLTSYETKVEDGTLYIHLLEG